eukprot:511832-Ditylum_brightwellii.AAC.1
MQQKKIANTGSFPATTNIALTISATSTMTMSIWQKWFPSHLQLGFDAVNWNKLSLLEQDTPFQGLLQAQCRRVNLLEYKYWAAMTDSKSQCKQQPMYNQAMNGPVTDGFKDIMDEELGTVTDMKSWIIIKSRPGMIVLGST